jgi:hypothetical protein
MHERPVKTKREMIIIKIVNYDVAEKYKKKPLVDTRAAVAAEAAHTSRTLVTAWAGPQQARMAAGLPLGGTILPGSTKVECGRQGPGHPCSISPGLFTPITKGSPKVSRRGFDV